MLQMQTDMCFPFEYNFYNKVGIGNMHTVVEIGCGNAYFLNKLCSYFPHPKYLGYDHCDELIKEARLKNSDDRIIVRLGSIENLSEMVDGIILRLIMHQISERKDFLKKVVEKLNNDGTILVVDSLDMKFKMFPELPKFMDRLKQLRSILSPGNASRQVKTHIEDEMKNLGFKLCEQEHYFMPSLLPRYKEKYRNYMMATNNMLGDPQEEITEIEEWYDNPSSYAQIGLFMYSFKKARGDNLDV
ncbi:MAG: class I SAM-dependent methyltransferase [Gammaproteobacteria bacterium]|jgi:SAM-dependent methyltransferase